jgi:hypothetical protein
VTRDATATENGFVTARQTDGVWWLVDGQGRPFVTLGINHVQPDCWLAPYNHEASLTRYGADLATPENGFNPDGQGFRRLMDRVLSLLGQWHFNTLGIHTYGVPTRLFRDRVFYAVEIGAAHFGSRFRFGQDTFPDVFAPAFADRVEARTREVCLEHRDAARLIGYCFTDIPRWYFFPGHDAALDVLHPWVNDLRSQPAGTPGKTAWIEVLRRRYGAADLAARAHGADFASWAAAAALTRWPPSRDPAAATLDNQALLAAAAGRWYDLHVAAIRRHDPNHLILGDKLHSPHTLPDWFVPIVRRSVDVLFIQWFLPFAAQAPHLTRLYETLGKPIVNGDGSAAFLKPPRQTRVKGHMLAGEAEVGQHYADYMRGIMGLPFMLGWHHCGFVEQWDGARPPNDWQINENGLMDPFEVPYPLFVAGVEEANRQANTWHSASARSTPPAFA